MLFPRAQSKGACARVCVCVRMCVCVHTRTCAHVHVLINSTLDGSSYKTNAFHKSKILRCDSREQTDSNLADQILLSSQVLEALRAAPSFRV